MRWRILCGDVREMLAQLEPESVQCVVTSPPYFGLRSYMPNTVQLRDDLTDEERDLVMKELTLAGVRPTTDKV